MFQVRSSRLSNSSRFQVPGSRFPESRIVLPNSELGTRNSELRPNPEPGTRNPELRREYGFTLLEVIVALAILAVAFALAMELLANGVRAAKASEDYTQAVLLARQKIAEISVTSSLKESADQGEFGGGFRWASEIQPLPQEEEDLPTQLYQVRVRVTWPGRRREKSFDLYTLRMAVDEKKLGQPRRIQPPGAASKVKGQ
jgi:general secretion pathway protein I